MTPMSAERLREAAALMRETAEKAEQGHWKLWGMTVMADPKGTSNVDDAIPVANTHTPSWCEPQLRTWNAGHIASWHPAVALAVADLLDVWAEHDLLDSSGSLADEKAAILAVANAFLGGAS